MRTLALRRIRRQCDHHRDLRPGMTIATTITEALVVVDLQNDFCQGGALPVRDGHAIVPLVNRLLEQAAVRVLTQDWHPVGHPSFAASHAGAAPGDRTIVGGVEQTLWPVHCVQGTPGAMFHPGLHADRADVVVRKGFRPEIDSYSAFFENDRTTPSGLDGYLRSRGVRGVAIVGLALDVCVAASAVDAARLGYATRVILAACRGIDVHGSLAAATGAMRSAGVVLDTGDEPW
jgi:nicotinamidase/pyrazinamidase